MEKKIKENLIYKGRIITLYNDDVICDNNKLTKREYVHHNGGAGILAVKDDKILLIKQFRYPYHKEIFEIPAGKIELGESPYLTAIRELEEECALKASSLEELGYIYPTCGYSDEVIYLYLAKEFILTKTNFDEDDSLAYFQKRLRDDGIIAKLREIGLKDKDTVVVGDIEFEYTE